MVALLNTSIAATYGKYEYEPLTLENAKQLARLPCGCCQGGGCPVCSGFGNIDNFESTIGHESTAEILSELLDVKVEVNRQNFIQQPKTQAIVFKLKTRAPEGVILDRKQIEKIGYEFGLLSRVE